MGLDETRLRAVLDGVSARPDIGPVSFALARPETGWSWSYESETEPKPYFVGSITNMYTAALALQLRQEGLLDLDEPIAAHLGADLLAGLHVYREHDRSEELTARQLLSQTSGLADYFEQRRAHDGASVRDDALRRDRGWTFEQALSTVRTQLRPAFPPGTGRRAFYSDTNALLLGRVIEVLTGRSWEQAVTERILSPLSLASSWPFGLADVERYDTVAAIHNGPDAVRIPLTMASVRAQGSLVSTADDGIVFLRAFLGGELFDRGQLDEMTGEWRRIAFPLSYGLGLMRFSMPRLLSPGAAPREFFGHGGSTGSVLFHAPESGLFISGTVNQLKNKTLAYRLMARLAALAVE
ncbi:serine hydrolase domain-containing protein [Homoserinimonas aerilata]|uniref:serine hydrolase domain-containing protein n=1 Tax=Homoserinimonas aerilata TaxID=1162970 RepID=UPI00114ECF31|nr:serine hydrolase domain-containing protein [Homoserinimonas aerilata]